MELLPDVELPPLSANTNSTLVSRQNHTKKLTRQTTIKEYTVNDEVHSSNQLLSSDEECSSEYDSDLENVADSKLT